MLSAAVTLASYLVFTNIRDFVLSRREMQVLVRREWNRQSWIDSGFAS